MTDRDGRLGGTGRVSRRTLVKGAAWSLPVIAVAVSAPMASASGVPKVVITSLTTSPSGSNTAIGANAYYYTNVCITNQGDAEFTTPPYSVFVDYPSGLNVEDLSKVVLSDPAWQVVAYTQNAPTVGRDRLHLSYTGNIALGESKCVTIGQWTEFCTPAGAFTVNAIEYLNSSMASHTDQVAVRNPSPTIYPLGVSNYPNTGNMNTGQTAGSVRVGTSFQMLVRLYNPGNVSTSEAKDIYIDLPPQWSPTIAPGTTGFTQGSTYPSLQTPGYYTTHFHWNGGTLRPWCSSADEGQLWINVAVPSNYQTGVNWAVLGTTVDPNGVVQTSYMYTFPAA